MEFAENNMDHQLQEFEVVTLAVKRSGGMFGLPQKVTLLRQRHLGRAEYCVEELGNGVSLELAAIPGGTFQMGAPNSELNRHNAEGPQHQVIVKPFLMAKYPVTQAQWQVIAGLPKINQDLDLDPYWFKVEGNHPVERVTWLKAVEFCDRLSQKTSHKYRLPSEAEWEYACRAGTTTPFHFGETITTDLANYFGRCTYGPGPEGESRSETTEVGNFPPNAFGLYDMHGNVCEWCLDHGHDSYQGAPNDGSAWIADGISSSRIVRGGSYLTTPTGCRSACRSWIPPDCKHATFGFRVVCGST